MRFRFRHLLFFLSCIPVLSAQTDQRANLFRLAQVLEQQADFERALQVYSELYRTDSSNFSLFDGVKRMSVQLKRYDEAIRITKDRLLRTPADISLRTSLGSLYQSAGKESTADSVWSALLVNGRTNPMLFRLVATEQANLRLFDKAIATYRSGRAVMGDRFLFAGDLGYLYSVMMDYAGMTREYLLMIDQNEQQYDFVQSRLVSVVTRPEALKAVIDVVQEQLVRKESVPVLRLQLWLLMEAKRITDALAVVQKLESLVNSQGQELFNFAERAFRENEFTAALTAYQQAITGNPQAVFVPSARYGIARCMEELSIASGAVPPTGSADRSSPESRPDLGGAVSMYGELVKQFPISPIGANALYRIGWIRFRKTYDLDGARRVFDSLITTMPGGSLIPAALDALGEIAVAKNELPAATTAYQRMASSPYANTDQKNAAQFRLAEIQFFREDMDSALAILKPLTENLKADESNDALLLQYFIIENQMQFASALRQYAQAELLDRQGKWSEASSACAAILESAPAAPLADDVLLKIAEIAIRLKRYPDALSAYNKLLDDYKESILRDKTLFKMGELYQFPLNEKTKAIDAYQMMLEKYPLSLFADEARKRIRLLRGDAI